MDFSTWLAFFAASWAISVSPGPGALAPMSAGLNHAFRRGYFTTLGLVLGIWTQLLVVGAGLGALMAASATAFAFTKWCGVAYLVWLGLKQWRTMVLRGWMLNAVNPKGTVFLLAVVPQFISPAQALAPQYLLTGLTPSFTDLVVMAGYTALASRGLAALRSATHMRVPYRVFGGLFVAAGALLAVFKRTA
ncbi:MAG: threonine transporter RhtB [Leptothrix sp. (in: Bacteria)]|nr:threonine transporter RhtB [Leptothrix sp. (in: b-proteobacteria)]